MKTSWLVIAIPVMLIARLAPCQEPRIKVGISSNVTAGVPDTYAKAVGKRLADYIAQRVKVPHDVEMVHGETASEIRALCTRLESGNLDMAAIWGIEFGWMRGQFRNLEIACVEAPSKGAALRSQLMVREDFDGKDIEALRGMRRAVYPRTSVPERLYLTDLLSQQKGDPKQFFIEVPFASVNDAAWAVCEGAADCILIGDPPFFRISRNQPGLKLRILSASKEFTPVVLVGRPSAMNEKVPGLWQKTVAQLMVVHLSDEGKEFCQFWRMDKFTKPDDAFHALVRENVDRFPIAKINQLLPH